MRLFFASWPPAEVASALFAWAQEAQRDCGGRVTRPETIHLTLAFLGETDAGEAKALAGAVRAPATSFAIEQARYWDHNRIVWVGPRQTPPELGQLARVLGETGRYAAHVTLIRKARAPRRLPPVPALDWPVPEFVLASSTLAPEGARYEVLARYALG
jgi:2'-5' RNA ligase